jgi:hypothetical protein
VRVTYRKAFVLIVLGLSALTTAAKPKHPAFEFDHVWIAVVPGAPERALLERDGFHVAPGVNRHEGQGTASISFEFTNTFLELIWADSSVLVDPGREAVPRRFRQRSAWRTSGASPIGIHVHRTPGTPDSLPFPTWPLHVGWMPEGAVYRMITPRTDSISASFNVLPRGMHVAPLKVPPASALDSIRVTALDQPEGARTVTRMRLLCPPAARNTDATRIFQSLGAVEVVPDSIWAIELTLEKGSRGTLRDYRPALPLVIRW